MPTRRLFVARLRRLLPEWEARGWVDPAHREAILAHAAAPPQAAAGRLALVLYGLGAVLFGTGAITYVAANWGGMSKPLRLALLAGLLWGTFALGAWLEARTRHTRLAGALAVLGVLVFGANINLIGQTYNISAHYPNGVLMWALGGLLAAALLRSEGALVLAVALGALWTHLERWEFDWAVHWPFLALWAACMALAWRHGWRRAAHAGFLALLLWLANTLLNERLAEALGAPLYVVQLALLAALALMLAGRLAARFEAAALFAPLQRYGGVAALGMAWLLTFPRLHEQALEGGVRAAATGLGIGTTLGGIAVVLLLGALAHAALARTRRTVAWGLPLLGALLALLAVNALVTGAAGATMAVLFNVGLFAGLVWLVAAGQAGDDRFLVNTAFVFFGLLLLSRYFDTFWTLLGRSLFFMAGGLLLLAGGLALERLRRRVLGGSGDPGPGGTP